MQINGKKLDIKHITITIGLVLFFVLVIVLFMHRNTVYFEDDHKSLKLQLGEGYQLIAKDKKDNSDIVYESKDSSIASIDQNGKIYARKSGKTYIYAGTKKKARQARILVDIPYQQSVTNGFGRIHVKNKPNMKFEVNSTYALDASIDKDFSKHDSLVYSSDNPSIVSIDSHGKMTMNGVGNTKVKVQIKDTDIKEEYDINVTNKIIKIQKIKVDKDQKRILEVGEKMHLNTHFFPENADNKEMNYISSEPTIASINDDGQIEALRPGAATITIKSKDGNASTKVKLNISKKEAYLTNDILKNAGIDECDKVMFVAHPDDESLWGGGHLLQDKYFVVCMTNAFNDVRKKEFYRALEFTQDKGIILPYPDLADGDKSNWEYNKSGAKKDIDSVLSYKNWTQVVTHSPRGETGHRHHKFVNQLVTSSAKEHNLYKNLVYFGKFYEKNEVPNDLKPNLKEDIINKKYELLDIYAAEKKSIEAFWKQMVPFEYWKKASIWKDK